MVVDEGAASVDKLDLVVVVTQKLKKFEIFGVNDELLPLRI